MTPTWESIIMVYAEAAINGQTLEGRNAGFTELKRCAQAADKYNKLVKEDKIKK